MSTTRNVAQVLVEHVTLEVECIFGLFVGERFGEPSMKRTNSTIVRPARNLALGVYALVVIGCHGQASSGNASDSSHDAAVAGSDGGALSDGASSLDAGVESDDGGENAGSSSNACSAGEEGCTCEWSPALRLGVFAPESEYRPHLECDASGAAVVVWISDRADDAAGGQLTYRLLDPSTELWTQESPVHQHNATSSFLVREAQGSLLVFAQEADLRDWMGSRLDPVKYGWSEPSFLGAPGTGMGSVVTSPGYTYWVNYPAVSRFTEAGFEPSLVRALHDTLQNTSAMKIDVDGDGNLVAAWTEYETVLRTANDPTLGPLTFPVEVPVDVSVSSYDPSLRKWSTPEKLQIEGWLEDIAFAADGDLYSLYVIDGARSLQRRDAITGKWTEPQIVPSDSRFVRDGNGGLYRLHSCPEGECAFGMAKLDPVGETWAETTVASAGIVEMWTPRFSFAFAGEHGVVKWYEDCDTESTCSVRVSQMTGVNEWSSPTTIARANSTYNSVGALAVGEDGTIAWSWIEGERWRYGDPGKLFAVRYDPVDARWSDSVELDAASYIGNCGITVDNLGNVTALWSANYSPYWQAEDDVHPAEVWSSRYACRRQRPKGTTR